MLIDISDKFLKKLHKEHYSDLPYEHFIKRLKNKTAGIDKTEALNAEKQKVLALQETINTLSKKSDSPELAVIAQTLNTAINELVQKEFKAEVVIPPKPSKWSIEVTDRDISGDIKSLEIAEGKNVY